jgi:hypothetical protein
VPKFITDGNGRIYLFSPKVKWGIELVTGLQSNSIHSWIMAAIPGGFRTVAWGLVKLLIAARSGEIDYSIQTIRCSVLDLN